MSFIYGGIRADDLEGVNVTPLVYPNLGGLELDTVETPGRDGRYYGGSRMTTSQLSFRVTILGENQMQADQRRMTFLQMLDPSLGPRSLRLDNTANWHYPQAVVSQQIEWEKHADSSKVLYDGEVIFETNFDPAMRQIEPSTVSGTGQVEFIADMGSTVSYPTVIFESGGDLRVRVNDFTVDLHDTPPDTYGVLNWDEYKFYTAEPDEAQSILYEWEGEPHASPSEKKVGGGVVARNWVENPSFEEGVSGLNTAGNNILESFYSTNYAYTGTRSLAFRGKEGITADNAYAMQVFDIGSEMAGKWVAFTVRGLKPFSSGPSHYRLRIQLQRRGSNIVSDSGDYLPIPRTLEMWEPSIVQIPEEIDRVRVLTWFFGSAAYTTPDLGVIMTDAWHVAIADTEQDALAQIEHYFDGDTVGHVVPGERISSLVNHMEHFDRPSIFPGQRVEVEVTPIGSNTATPVIIYPNHRRL